MPAVSNTSPIFNLACIGRLELLRRQFGEVWIPLGVETELTEIPDAEIRRTVEQTQIAGWLIVRPLTEADVLKLLMVDLHSGEAEAIALAVETKADWVLIDEREGRAVARRLGLRITGVLGVLQHRFQVSGEIFREEAQDRVAVLLKQSVLVPIWTIGLSVAQMQRSIDFDGDTSVFAEKIDFHAALSVEWNPKLMVEAKATARLLERL